MSLLTKCLIFLFLVASDMGLCYDRSNKYRILSVVLSDKGRRLRIKLRGDILEYNNDFERRRAYISSREKLRKRRRTVHITILLIVLGVLLLGIGGLLLFKKGGRLSTQLKNNTSESSAESDPSGDDKTTAAPAAAYNTGDTALDGILNSAHAKFVTYDYDAAIEILNSNPDYAENSDVKELLASCEETKSTLVRADVNKITHVFFHSLIMDNSKAFDGDADSKGYNQVMTTKSEFLKILDSMYEKGYVLVKLHDIAHEVTDENGNTKMVAGDIMLPPGKIPFVMSQDDLCYYEYMDGDGFASRMIVGENGKPTCEMVMDHGTPRFFLPGCPGGPGVYRISGRSGIPDGSVL